jgi:hypothetical protein
MLRVHSFSTYRFEIEHFPRERMVAQDPGRGKKSKESGSTKSGGEVDDGILQNRVLKSASENGSQNGYLERYTEFF